MAVQSAVQRAVRPLIPRRAYAPIAVLLGVLALVFVALTVKVAGTSDPNTVDTHVASWLGRHTGHDTAQVMLAFTEPVLVIGVVAIVAVVCAVRRHWDSAVLAAVTTPLAVVLSSVVLKPIIDRKFGIQQYYGLEYGYAFPSGHETMAVSALGALLVLFLRTAAPTWAKITAGAAAALWALLAAAGLVRNGYHYATDTVGGFCVAVIVTVAVAYTIDTLGPRLRRISSPDARSPSRTPRAA